MAVNMNKIKVAGIIAVMSLASILGLKVGHNLGYASGTKGNGYLVTTYCLNNEGERERNEGERERDDQNPLDQNTGDINSEIRVVIEPYLRGLQVTIDSGWIQDDFDEEKVREFERQVAENPDQPYGIRTTYSSHYWSPQGKEESIEAAINNGRALCRKYEDRARE